MRPECLEDDMGRKRAETDAAETAETAGEQQVDRRALEQQERAETARAVAAERGLDGDMVQRALDTGRHEDPTVDTDPVRAAAVAQQGAELGAVDEESALRVASETGRQVRIPGHPRGFYARPDGSSGPLQPL